MLRESQESSLQVSHLEVPGECAPPKVSGGGNSTWWLGVSGVGNIRSSEKCRDPEAT